MHKIREKNNLKFKKNFQNRNSLHMDRPSRQIIVNHRKKIYGMSIKWNKNPILIKKSKKKTIKQQFKLQNYIVLKINPQFCHVFIN